ncbi:hypothetical protein L1049_004941 [Liquidambar formosana]|uniref:Translation initiation factor eIF2B subunit alpha n=2 Tax=Liquidambar formosana TaxID=63359 RepID=A0AAP0RQ28_LIQFO
MGKVHPQAPLSSASCYLTSKQEVFTIWMKSLVLSGKGCTVFDSNGQIVYRVDNYNCKCSNEVYLMDFTGKVLFTILRKKFKLFRCWEGYRSTGTEINKGKPGFQLKKSFSIPRRNSLCEVIVGSNNTQPQHYKIESWTSNSDSACRIVDQLGGLIAEVKRKRSTDGIVLGNDVLTMVVEPYIDHSLIMGLVMMWWRSASFILDKREPDNAKPESLLSSSMSETLQNPNPNPNISAYYQTRAAHHGVITSDWLAQAQAAVGRHPSDDLLSHDNDVRSSDSGGKPFSVIDEFNSWRKQPDLAEAVAAIRALASVIRSSEATTMMELEIELKKASDSLKSWDTTSISLTAGCDLFMRYVTRTSALEYEDFNSAKSRLIERAEKFGEISCKARRIIAMLSQDFIVDGCTILVHGFSRVVLEVLKTAAQNKKLFRVFCTEGRPDRTGLRLSNELAKLDVPVKLLIDSAVAYTMDEVDMVFVGADGVVESGGIINMMGTYQIALVAHSMNKPVYVAAESYKFARLYPLDQKDMAPALRPIDFGVPIPSRVEVETSARDYTPPQYLTLLFTDLGVLTPSVVSDELIQLYL